MQGHVFWNQWKGDKGLSNTKYYMLALFVKAANVGFTVGCSAFDYTLCFKTRASFGAHHENLNEDRLYYQLRRCSPMTLDSSNIKFMRIFAVVLKIYVNFP